MLFDRAPLTILIAAVAVLGGAFAFQYIGHLAPCELCILQRWHWAGVILLAAVALFAPGAEKPHLYLCGAILIVGAGIALYHVGVEQHWIAGPEACTGGPSGISSLDDLRKKLLATQVVRCDEPAWTMLGVSMAGYNALASLALAAFSLAAAHRKKTA